MYIDSLTIENFKGFTIPVKITGMNDKNLLIYGANGTGKSSLYAALKLLFYYDRMKTAAVRAAVDPTDEQRLEHIWLDSYNNKANGTSFAYTVNGRQYVPNPVTNVEVYMLSSGNIKDDIEHISLTEILNGLDYPDMPPDFLANNSQFIVENINDVLQNFFHENMNISLDGSLDYKLILEDRDHHLMFSSHLNIYFNEAKLHLVVLLVFLNAALLHKSQSSDGILILDDIINSFDQAYRVTLVKYILDNFGNYQIIMMTHNVSYYNLISKMAKSYHPKDKWLYRQFYQSGNDVILNGPTVYRSAKQIKDGYHRKTIPAAGIANVIRQYFETQIHELSHYLHMESVDESGAIINRLVNNKHIYLKKNGRHFLHEEDLLQTLEDIIDATNLTDAQKITKQRTKLTDYSQHNELALLIPIIKDIRTYQQLVLHQMSHGRTGLPTFNPREIDACLLLMEQLDDAIKNARHNIYEV